MNDRLNKIVQADCLEYLKELPDGCVDLVLIDPPYQITTKGGAWFRDRKHLNELQNICNGIPNEVLEELCRVCKIINFYIFCSKKQIPQFLNFFIAKKCHFDILTWHKTAPPPLCGDSYLPDTEYILYFRKSGATLNGNYHTKSKYYISEKNTKDKNYTNTQLASQLNCCCNIFTIPPMRVKQCLIVTQEAVAQLVASKILNRNFLACERDAGYVKIANDRLDNWQEDLLRQKEWLEKRGVKDFFDETTQPTNGTLI